MRTINLVHGLLLTVLIGASSAAASEANRTVDLVCETHSSIWGVVKDTEGNNVPNLKVAMWVRPRFSDSSSILGLSHRLSFTTDRLGQFTLVTTVSYFDFAHCSAGVSDFELPSFSYVSARFDDNMTTATVVGFRADSWPPRLLDRFDEPYKYGSIYENKANFFITVRKTSK